MDNQEAEAAPEAVDQTAEALAQIMARLTEMDERIAAMEAAAAPAEAEMAEEAPADEDEEGDATMALRAKLAAAEERAAKLTIELTRRDAKAELAKFSFTPGDEAKWLAVADRDYEAFKLAISAIPAPKRPTARLAIDADPNPDAQADELALDSDDPEVRRRLTNAAFALQREAEKAGTRLSMSKALRQAASVVGN